MTNHWTPATPLERRYVVGGSLVCKEFTDADLRGSLSSTYSYRNRNGESIVSQRTFRKSFKVFSKIGVETVKGDITDTESLIRAFQGAKLVYRFTDFNATTENSVISHIFYWMQ